VSKKLALIGKNVILFRLINCVLKILPCAARLSGPYPRTRGQTSESQDANQVTNTLTFAGLQVVKLVNLWKSGPERLAFRRTF